MYRCKHTPQFLKADPQAKAAVNTYTSPTREKLFFKISFPSKNFGSVKDVMLLTD
jgi:hypothetical protein